MEMFLKEATVVDQITQSGLSEIQTCHRLLAYLHVCWISTCLNYLQTWFQNDLRLGIDL